MEVSRNMKILAKLASMNKEAQGSPMLTSSLIGAGVGGLAGDLTSQLLWKKPTKTQRILSALVGAGLGAGTGAAVTGSFGHKVTQNIPARLQSMYQNAVGTLSGKLPSKEDFASMSPTAKAMYGSTNTGDKAADRLGSIVNTIKKSIVGPGDEYKVPIVVGQGAAGGLGGIAGWKVALQALNRQGRRMQLINVLQSKANTNPTLWRAADNLKIFKLKNNPITRFIGQVREGSKQSQSQRSYKKTLTNIRHNIHQRNAARKASGMGPLSGGLRKNYYDKYRDKILDANRLKDKRNASVFETLFGLNQRRAGQVFDNTGIRTGMSTEDVTKLRNTVTRRPLGKAKGAVALLASLLSGTVSAGGAGYIGNSLAGNNARYQQGLTNLQNAYK